MGGKVPFLAIFGHFGGILPPFCPPGGQPEFSRKIRLVIFKFILWPIFVQNFEKIQGTVSEKSADQRTDGRTDGRTDESELLGPIPPLSGDQQNQ